jgi:hypothetical protein
MPCCQPTQQSNHAAGWAMQLASDADMAWERSQPAILPPREQLGSVLTAQTELRGPKLHGQFWPASKPPRIRNANANFVVFLSQCVDGSNAAWITSTNPTHTTTIGCVPSHTFLTLPPPFRAGGGRNVQLRTTTVRRIHGTCLAAC